MAKEDKVYDVKGGDGLESTLRDSRYDLQGFSRPGRTYHLMMIDKPGTEEGYVRFRILSSPYEGVLAGGRDLVIPIEDFDEIVFPFENEERRRELFDADPFVVRHIEALKSNFDFLRAYLPSVLKSTIEEYLDHRRAKENKVESGEDTGEESEDE